jgi:hypothetical protein
MATQEVAELFAYRIAPLEPKREAEYQSRIQQSRTDPGSARFLTEGNLPVEAPFASDLSHHRECMNYLIWMLQTLRRLGAHSALANFSSKSTPIAL